MAINRYKEAMEAAVAVAYPASIKELFDYPYVHCNDVSAISCLKLVGLYDHPNQIGRAHV